MALTIQQQYDQASAALHNLKIGKAVAEVTDQNGEKIRYFAADRAKLEIYVADLKRQLDGADYGAASPMTIWGR